MDTTQATTTLVAQVIQMGLGATSLAIILWSVAPRLRRVSRRALRTEQRVQRIERKLGIVTPAPGLLATMGGGEQSGVITPPRGVPVGPENFDDNTAH